MSSTMRGGEVHASSYYRTPRWVTKRLIEASQPMAGEWLEPSAGDGAIVRAFNEVGNRSIVWSLIELREEEVSKLADLGHHIWCPQDCLERMTLWKSDKKHFDRIITNPPFPLAFEMLKAALLIAPRVTFLQRLNWLGSEERADFFRDHMPDIAELPNRPCFTLNAEGKAAVDSIEYAWYTFHGASEPGEEIPLRKRGSISILASTSKEERRVEIEELIAEQRLLKKKGNDHER